MRVVERDEMMDTTLLVQGSLREDTYKFYCRFYPDVPKVFSTWEGNEYVNKWGVRYFEDMKKTELKRSGVLYEGENTMIVENKVPRRFHKRQNFDLQLTSTLSGLRFVHTKYVIKLRGDEWYSNLCRVEDTLLKDEGKIMFAPIFFRRWEFVPFHISDHLMAGEKEDVKIMFGESLKAVLSGRVLSYEDDCNDGMDASSPYACGLGNYVAESMLGRMYIEAKHENRKDYKHLFKRNFGVIDLNQLTPYKVCANCSGKIWYSRFEDSDSIASMEEL